MTKKERMIKRKNIRNHLPKYDLGTTVDNNQYQLTSQIGQGVAEKGVQKGNQYITTARQDQQGANLSGKASAYGAQKTASVLNTATTPLINTAVSGVSAASTHIAPASIALTVPSATSTEAVTTGSLGATTQVGGSTASTVGSTVGGVTSLIGGLGMLGKGIFDAFNVADQFDMPAISDSEFNEMKGEQTLSGINGVQYKQKTGINMSTAKEIGNEKEGADIAAASNAGMGIGSGAGAIATGIMALAMEKMPVFGWFLGPIFGAIGAAIGAGAGAAATDASDIAMSQSQQVNNATELLTMNELGCADRLYNYLDDYFNKTNINALFTKVKTGQGVSSEYVQRVIKGTDDETISDNIVAILPYTESRLERNDVVVSDIKKKLEEIESGR